MKKALAAVLVAVVAVAGVFGYQKYRAAQFKDVVQPAVKAATIRVGNIIETEIKPSNITFKESFDRAETTIKEIESAMVTIQAMDHSPNPQLAEQSLTYMRESVNLVRAFTSVNRKLLASNVAHETFKEALSEVGASSGYGTDIAIRGMDRAMEKAKKATQELEESSKAASEASASFGKAADQLRPMLEGGAVLSPEVVGQLADKYSAKAESNK